jgi:asparagine synthase (glutamine-hydrolysing)
MRIYVRSDVPFGAFLSGGVDSSTVTAYMGRCLNNPVKTYTIGYQDNAFSELPYAEMAAKILKTVHCSYVVDANYSEEFIVNLIRHFGEPFADSSAIPTFFVSQLAAKNVKMVLSGDGGDELFGGYNSYRDIFVQSCRNSSFSGTILNMIGSILRRDDSGKSFTSIQQSQRNLFNFEDLQSLVLDKSLVKKRICEKTTDVNMINCFQLQDFKSYLVDDVLTKVDRMSMANSLEVRVPLLDHNLVEFAFSLPLNQKIRCVDKQIVTKYLLKSVAHTSFPQDFLERPKQGFGIPIANWLASRGLSSVKNIINKNNPIFEFLSYEATSRIVNRFVSGEQDQAAKVWSLLIFSLWLGRVHMKTDTAEQ